MLTDDLAVALHQATYDLLPEGEGYYGEIAALPGVWVNAPTLELCREEQRQTLVRLGRVGLAARPYAALLAGIDLNASLVAEIVQC